MTMENSSAHPDPKNSADGRGEVGEVSGLACHLERARHAAGSPSLRTIAATTDYSHTTVAKAFTPAAATLSWCAVEQIGAAVGAEAAVTRRLWDASQVTRAPLSPRDQPRPVLAGAVLPALLVSALFIGAVAIGVAEAIDDETTVTVFGTDAAQTALMISAVAIFGYRAAVHRRSGNRDSFLFFGLLAVGYLMWAAGQTLWFVDRSLRHNPIPDGHLHDVGFMSMPIFVGAALWIRADRYGAAAIQRRRDTIAVVVAVTLCSLTMCVALLHALQFRTAGFVVVYALYPATDMTLALMALSPMLSGYRIVGSTTLATAFLAATASDIGYLLLRANPAAPSLPPTAALGYIAFTIVVIVYACIARPIPVQPRQPLPLRTPGRSPQQITAAITVISSALTIIAASSITASRPGATLAACMFVVIVCSTTILACRALTQTTRDATPDRSAQRRSAPDRTMKQISRDIRVCSPGGEPGPRDQLPHRDIGIRRVNATKPDASHRPSQE